MPLLLKPLLEGVPKNTHFDSDMRHREPSIHSTCPKGIPVLAFADAHDYGRVRASRFVMREDPVKLVPKSRTQLTDSFRHHIGFHESRAISDSKDGILESSLLQPLFRWNLSVGPVKEKITQLGN